MNITIEEAFTEACAALGEAIVKERLLAKKVTELEATVAAVTNPDVVQDDSK